MRNDDNTLSSTNSASQRSDAYDIQVFFQLCEVAVGFKQTVGATKQTIVPRRDNSKTKWKNIRRWLEDNPDLRHAACVQQGKFNTVPLHILCQEKSVPYDIIETVVESAPEVVSWEDSNGWLALHYACAKGLSLNVLKVLVYTYPEGQKVRDQRLRTPLHWCFYKNNSSENENSNVNENGDGQLSLSGSMDVTRSGDDMDMNNDVVEKVLLLKGAVEIIDEKRRLPIHFAAAYGTSVEALEELIKAYPESVYAKEESGCTPLHYAMANAHRKSSPSMIELLLRKMNETGINAQDDNGNIPLQLLCFKAHSIHESRIIDIKQNTSKSLEIYLNAKPQSSADFLTTLQSLPQWLRDKAVIHTHVKDILNRNISNRFPTSILILDGYFYLLIIICFSHVAQVHIKYCFEVEPELPSNTSSFITACLVGVTYFLNRELSQIVSTINLGTFQAWILNAENWLDIAVVILLLYYCWDMQIRQDSIQVTQDFGSDRDKDFRVGAAITIGALWAATISYLKSCSLECSLFFETVLYVTRKIFVYLIVLVVVLIAFSQMFLIIFRSTPVCSQECSSGEDGWIFPHCTFNNSFWKVYTMMLGEVGDVNRYQHKLIAQVLYLAFVFLVVILLSNVLIAMVTESHTFIKNERAEMVFWSNRLDFVAEMDTIVVIKRNIFKFLRLSSSSEYSRTNASEPTATAATATAATATGGDHETSAKSSSPRTPFRHMWKNMIDFLQDDAFLTEAVLTEVILYGVLKVIVVVIVIPLWIVLGIATAGWFFPPQVREWLFVMKDDNNTVLKSNLNVDHEIDMLSREVAKGRSEMKAELAAVRQDCRLLRNEMEDITSTVKGELKAVRDLTDALLQLYDSRKQQRPHIPENMMMGQN